MASVTSYDVCNLSHLYETDGYQHPLPKSVLESYLSGKAFDHPNPYTEQEAFGLQADINGIFQNIVSHHPVNEKIAVMTAGGPGAGKTFLMRQDMAAEEKAGRKFAYIDPDDVCLRQMTNTYLADIQKGDGSRETRQAAYNKWRPGSNAATHLILGNLFREGLGFYFGTTSTGATAYKLLEFLKTQGYQIRLLHVTAPDDVRWASIQKRDESFVQTTEQDIKEKGLLLPQRINDTYLAFADEIEFYYRDGVNENAKLAATWVRKADASELQVVDPASYEKIKAIHNTVVTALNRPELLWETTVEKPSTKLDLP